MPGKYFIDTNIIVYGFDDLQPRKKEISLALVSNALQTDSGMINWQVVQEFLNVSTRKFKTPLRPEDAKLYLQKVLDPLCRVFPELELYQSALEIMAQTRYSFYDSLILAGAKKAGCTILYTEDMQRDQIVDGVKIVNPFD
jgi:predicted nucleic acid-binding protein